MDSHHPCKNFQLFEEGSRHSRFSIFNSNKNREAGMTLLISMSLVLRVSSSTGSCILSLYQWQECEKIFSSW